MQTYIRKHFFFFRGNERKFWGLEIKRNESQHGLTRASTDNGVQMFAHPYDKMKKNRHLYYNNTVFDEFGCTDLSFLSNKNGCNYVTWSSVCDKHPLITL